MKKRIVMAAVLAVCAVSFSSCKKGADIELVTEDPDLVEVETQAVSSEDEAQSSSAESETKRKKKVSEKYSHTMETFEIGNSKIEYPIVDLMKNSNYLDTTNATIMADIEAAAEYYGLSNSNNVLNAEVDSYYVTDDEELMSIIFMGELTSEDGSEKEVRFTININLENGENYRLAERADIEKIAEILADTDDFKVVNTDEKIRPKQKSHIKSYTKERLTQMLQDADFTIDENGKAIYPEVFSSLENSSAYLEIGVEVPDEIGSHAEYLVDKAVLKAGI